MIGSTEEETRARAFARLVDRHALDDAYRYATLMLGDRSEAEDAAHDAALAAWRHFGDLRDPDRFDAWFGRILVNACRDRLRNRRRLAALGIGGRTADPARGDAEAAHSSSAREVDPADAVARRAALEQALRALSPDHREVVVLRFWADLTIEQIAARTGEHSGTVKSRLHYALRHLRAAVGESGMEDVR